MAYSLDDILGLAPLTEALKTTTDNLPDSIPAEFYATDSDSQILGDQAKYFRVKGSRQTSKRTRYGAPGVKRDLAPIDDQQVRLLHIQEEIEINVLEMQKLQSFQEYVQDSGMDWLSYQIDFAGRRIGNTRIVATTSVLRNGAIYFDSEGELLATSAGAAAENTISFQVPATHQNQINGLVTASWSDITANIPLHLRAIRDYNAQETGLELKKAFYGKNVPEYIMNNANVQAFLVRDNYNQRYVDSNEIPSGLFGFDWIPMHQQFYEQEDGTNVSLWDDDLVVLTPEVRQGDKMSWWKFYEGSYKVPRTLSLPRDPMTALSNFELVYGQFGFTEVVTIPPGLVPHFGDTFLPGLRNEKAIYQIDTAF